MLPSAILGLYSARLAPHRYSGADASARGLPNFVPAAAKLTMPYRDLELMPADRGVDVDHTTALAS